MTTFAAAAVMFLVIAVVLVTAFSISRRRTRRAICRQRGHRWQMSAFGFRCEACGLERERPE